MSKEIAKFIISSREYELLIEPRMTLVEQLRDELDLTGTKRSCAVGECGSCTVLIDGKPQLSCCTLAINCQGEKHPHHRRLSSRKYPAPTPADICKLWRHTVWLLHTGDDSYR